MSEKDPFEDLTIEHMEKFLDHYWFLMESDQAVQAWSMVITIFEAALLSTYPEYRKLLIDGVNKAIIDVGDEFYEDDQDYLNRSDS